MITALRKHSGRGAAETGESLARQRARSIGQSARLDTARLYARRRGEPGQAVLRAAGDTSIILHGPIQMNTRILYTTLSDFGKSRHTKLVAAACIVTSTTCS